MNTLKSSQVAVIQQLFSVLSRFLLVGIAILLTSFFLSLLFSLQPAFDSDEYLHASPALDLQIFLGRQELGDFLARLLREVFYPPLHPLFLSLVFSIFGCSATVARVFSWLLFLGSVAFTAGAVRRVVGDSRLVRHDAINFTCLVGLLCPAAFLSSILCMLEPLGMFIVSAMLFVISAEKPNTARQALFLGLLFAAAALTKHTLPLLLFPGIFLATLVGDSSREKFWGEREKIISRAFLFFLCIWGIWALSVSSGALYRFLFGHHARGYVLGLYENTTYFRSLFIDFHLITPLAIMNLCCAIFALVRRNSCFVVRVAGYSLLCSMVMLGFIAEQGYRHLSMLSPCLYLLGGVGFSEFRHVIGLRSQASSRLRYSGLFISLLSLILFGSVLYYQGKIRSMMFTQLEIKPEQDEALQALQQVLPGRKPYLIIGNDNLAFSYHLLWMLAARDRMTLHEARNLRKVLSDELEEVVKRAGKDELLDAFERISVRYDPAIVVILGRKKWGDPSSVRVHHVDQIEESICKEKRCKRFETSQFSLLQVSIP